MSCCTPARGGGHEEVRRPLPAHSANQIAHAALADIPGFAFAMGTDDPRGYAEDGEGPRHEVELPPYRIGSSPVTNGQFTAFVEDTGHLTTAEQYGTSFVFAGLLPGDFPPTRGVAAAPWWREVPGADWRHPEGAHSDLTGREQHPVVHVSWYDARSYCAWSGARLPSEAEWECAARGGLADQHFPWGGEREPGGRHLMNVFQGEFPGLNTAADGWVGTSPVGTYPPNGYGLHDTTGNVWEWCEDWFDPAYYRRSPTFAPSGPPTGTQRVLRGGSYLCHESYCWRYRVDSRSSSTPDSSTGNTGFRVAASCCW